MKPTIADAVAFIRSQNINDLDDDQLTLLIRDCILHHGFDYDCDERGSIRGLYLGRWESPFTVFRVYLLVGKGSMLKLMKNFKKRYPLLERVVTGRHQKVVGTDKAAYSDEAVVTEYYPNKFKLIN